MNQLSKKPLFWGSSGAILLLILYFIILTLANSFSHALEQFLLLWYWILALVIGFGFQVGLYSYIRLKIRQRKIKAVANKELAASAGVSTGSMIACCAHHLIDVLPILGLSAVFLFLADYQMFFLLLGVASNVIGAIFMLEIIKKHALFKENSILSQASKFDLRILKNWTIAGSALVLLIAFLLIKNSQEQNSLENLKLLAGETAEASNDTDVVSLPSKTNNQEGLSIEVQPLDFSFNEPVQFEISLDTHQGNLDFDLTRKSLLLDDKDNQYLPLEWQGDKGGHHLSGTLIFPALQKETKQLKLIIKDIYGIKERIFSWDLYED